MHGVVGDLELELDEAAPVFLRIEPALDLDLPHAATHQTALFLVADPEVAVLERVDQQFGNAGDDAVRLRAQVGDLRRDQVAFAQVVDAEAAEGHQVEDAAALAQRFAQRLHVQAVVDRAAHDGLEHVAVVGLGQIVIRAGLEAVDDVAILGLGGLHDDRDLLEHVVLLDVGEHFHAVHAGHHAVEDDRVEAGGIGLEQRPGFFAGARGHEFVVIAFEMRTDDIQIDRFIVDD